MRELSIEFETQKKFTWSDNKKYDFYIPSMNMIIETHGMQHYMENTKFLRILKEEQYNDELKQKRAIENKIKTYLIIDCRNSDFNWLKENFASSINIHFNLSKVDWLKIWEWCMSSLQIKVWDAWNNKLPNETSIDICKKFKLGRRVVLKYLKNGTVLGKCNYDPKEEFSKNLKNNKINKSKTVFQYDKTMSLIKEWPSTLEIERETGFSSSLISRCCRGKGKTAYGFIWKYVKKIN